VEQAHVAMLDRWHVTVSSEGTGALTGGTHAQEAHHHLNNYCGVGTDAQIALEFHTQRNRQPRWFSSRWINKVWYGNIGAANTIAPQVAGLQQHITVWCDEEEDPLPLPEGTEGIILLNIDSYGGGARLWRPFSQGEAAPRSWDGQSELQGASMQDGLIEVVAVYGALHLGQLQVGLNSSMHLRQARHVRIQTDRTYPVQVDGEPWLQPPCSIVVTKAARQAAMLRKSNTEMGEVMAEMNAVLDWAEASHHINGHQRDVLMQEMARRVVQSRDGRGYMIDRDYDGGS